MQNDFGEGREVMTVEEGTVAMISRAEIDQQVATAKKYPRSLKRFVDEATAMVTLNESIAAQCVYALLRWDGKKQENVVIEGPSARFAEIVASAWGNCRAGARVVNEGAEFVTAQGVMHDLERNVSITYEVQRRITGSNGARYKADMIGVTANAACSIALRNSILKGIPKAFWEPMYAKARAVIAGDATTLSSKRSEAFKQFALYGISTEQILEKLNREGIQDITINDLVLLAGMLTAIKDGDTTPEQMFSPAEGPKAGVSMPGKKSQAQDTAAPATAASTDQQSGESKTEGKKKDKKPEQKLGQASEGERMYLDKKCENLGITLVSVAAEAGISDLENLTTDGFLAIKDLLAQKESA